MFVLSFRKFPALSSFTDFSMNSAKILYWNCRGILARETSSRVFRLIRTHNPLLFVLLKPEPALTVLTASVKKISKNWDWAAIMADGLFGGIIMFWNMIIRQVTPIASFRRALHIVISSDSS